MRMTFYVGFLILIFLFTGVAAAYSVPAKIPVQGRLSNASTGVVLSGEYIFTFRVYNASSGGTLLWDENQTLSVDGNGLWNALLGNNTAMSLNFSEDTYLEVELNHDGSPLPRVQLGSTPYAEWTDTASNLSCTDCLGTDEIEDVYLLNSGDSAMGNYTINGSLRVDNLTGSVVLYVNSSDGNIGIGTMGPLVSLDVRGRIRSNNTIASYINSSKYAYLYHNGSKSYVYATGDEDGMLIRSSGGIELYTPSSNISFSPAITEKMRITTDGNVGIGTTSPSQELEVSGSAIITGNLTLGGHNVKECNSASIDSTGWYRIASNGGDRADAQFSLRDFISGGGHSTVRFSAGVNYGDSNGVSFVMAGHSIYGTTTFTKVRILENSTYDGAYLEVYLTKTGSVEYCIWDNEQYTGWTAVNWSSGSLPDGWTIHEYDINELFVVGQINDSESFRVDRAGYVGIGATSVDYPLHIDKSPSTWVSKIESDTVGTFISHNSGHGMALRSTSTSDSVYLLNLLSGGSSPDSGGNSVLYVRADGYVGIGTASPVSVLTINTGTSGVNPSLADVASGSMAFGNGGSVSAAPMIVGRSDNAAGLVLRSGSPDGNTAGDMLFTVRENDDSDFSTTTSAAYIFYRYLTPLVTILRNGYVGIGTTSPNMKLVVVGDANITGNLYVSGQQMSVPDYVFEEGYDLMPLSELDAYIKSNKHLPGISPANETGQIDVVGQQQKLLEKIEELTLYSIQLKEENEELRRAVCVIDPDASVCAGARA